MFLTNTQFEQLLEFASLHDCPCSTFEPGSVLQSKDISNSLLLVKSGWVRVLDPRKKFQSFTISRFEAPTYVACFRDINQQITKRMLHLDWLKLLI